MARCLSRCHFVPGTPAKRFARDIGCEAENEEPEITERQAAYLRTLIYTYRRQIPRDVVSLAGDVAKQRRDFASQQQWRDEMVSINTAIREAQEASRPATAPASPDQLSLLEKP